jgi:hypothetical protein
VQGLFGHADAPDGSAAGLAWLAGLEAADRYLAA